MVRVIGKRMAHPNWLSSHFSSRVGNSLTPAERNCEKPIFRGRKEENLGSRK